MYSFQKAIIRYPLWPILVALLFWQGADGQNLVPNPSFEDVNICSELNQPCSPSAWFFLSRKLTTGYFPRYRSATGERHLQLVAASRETVNRQYWETMLLCPLQPGESYTVSLKVASPASRTALSNKVPNLRDIGFWFTNRFVFVQGDSLLQPHGYFSFTGATVKDLKNGWFEIKKEFVPTTAASILIVGNFVQAANVDIMDQRNAAGPTIDILVDDLFVGSVKGVMCPGYSKVKDSLYAIAWRHSDGPPEDEEVVSGEPGKDTSGRSGVMPGPPVARPPLVDTIVIHNIQFDFDKYLMQNPDTLQRYRSLFTKPGIKKILVAGYTDDIGSEAYNKDLSAKRAHEVARLLSTKFDLSPSLLEAEGRGISRTYPTRELNRRVEIYISYQ